nr:thioredoxin family protein [uncultured Flavobacterium sp.]
MRKRFLIILMFYSFISSASNWQTDFATAQRIALATNRFILIDFWASWCGPCKQMDMDTWSNQEVNLLTEDFVMLKIDIDANRELASMYSITSIPNMFIIDANGKKLISFSGYKSPSQLKNEVKNHLLSTEFIANELINVYKKADFRTLTSLIIKYYDYSLYVGKEASKDVVFLNREYLRDIKKKLNKKDANYIEQIQKVELLNLYEMAYLKKFDKLEKKLNEKFKDEAQVLFTNELSYNFLKYLVLKGNNRPELLQFEEKLRNSDFSFIIDKANRLITTQS